MSALHTAVARAIRDTSHGAPGGPLPVHNDQRWPDPRRPDCQTCNEAAAAAIRVVLAEATRSIEEDIPDTTWQGGIPDTEVGRGREGMRDEVLAVLAALGEHDG